jgi:hydrogenase maturation protease
MNVKNKIPRILIAGLGNELLADDGVGVHAVRELLKYPPVSGIIIVEVGTAVLNALHLIEWADRIIALDAMQAGAPVGTIYEFGVHDAAENSRQVSLHELNFMAALRFLPARHCIPEVNILGVEPETISYGLELSPAVQAALPRLVARVRTMITGNPEKTVTSCMSYL